MGFKEFVIDQTSGDGELPWIKDWLEQSWAKDEPVLLPVKSVSFGSKGVLIVTQFCKAFLFRSHPYHDFIREAVEHWSSQGVPVHCLSLMGDLNVKNGFTVGIEDTLETSWVKKTGSTFVSSYANPGISLKTKETNPLLATSSPLRSSTPAQGEEERRGKGGRKSAVAKAAVSLSKAFEDSQVDIDV